jgi:hypothetical protein
MKLTEIFEKINHSSTTIDCVAKKSVLIEVQNSLLSELTKLKDSRYNGFLFRYQTSVHTQPFFILITFLYGLQDCGYNL